MPAMKTFITPAAVAAFLFAINNPEVHAGESSKMPKYDYEPPQPGTYRLPVIKPASDGDVLDSKGKPRRLSDFQRSRVTVLSFIYTRCATVEACPYATGVLSQLQELSDADPALAKGLQLISLSFDPENDTPPRMAAYAKLAADRPSAAPWQFLTTTSPASLQPILAAYDQAVDKKANPADLAGPLNHTLRVYLLDAQARIRNIYSSGTLDLRLVLADIRTLMIEPSQAVAR